ncbi:MAG TPA: tetratricopeptide repeat protein [Pirellulaceae bacterium]|mgnify:CR=1 FL=1|nr:tetratricopeptide repeat protein [Pirellulaceae bacterium]HMO90925.1 tetratricopeptide repeat protein [Pirellulaceae bacterium]HMP68599.1 tetratricopeptide repeat protein [Pirellulaceae bacterium]
MNHLRHVFVFICFNIVLACSAFGQRPLSENELTELRELTAKIDSNQGEVADFVRRGKLLQSIGKFEAAIQDFDVAILFKPGDSQTHYLRGICRRDLAHSIDEFDVIMQSFKSTDPSNEGNLRAKLLKLAQDDFEQALKLPNPGDEPGAVAFQADVYFQRARIYRPNDVMPVFDAGGEYDRQASIQDFTKVIELVPEHLEAFILRGKCYMQEESTWANALADFNQAIEIDSSSVMAYLARSNFYSWTGDANQAIADASKAIEVDQQSEDALLHRGYLLLHHNEFDKAIADATRVVELNPNSVFGWMLKREAFAAQEKWDEALHCINNEMEIQTKLKLNLVFSRQTRAGFLKKLERFEEAAMDLYWVALSNEFLVNASAMDQLKELGLPLPSKDPQRLAVVQSMTEKLEANPRDMRTRVNRAIALATLKHIPMAMDELNALIQINPRAAILFYQRGNLFRDLKQFAKAIDDYSRSIELDSSRAIVFQERASVFHQMEKYNEAITDIDRAIELSQGDEKIIAELYALRVKSNEGLATDKKK